MQPLKIVTIKIFHENNSMIIKYIFFGLDSTARTNTQSEWRLFFLIKKIFFLFILFIIILFIYLF